MNHTKLHITVFQVDRLRNIVGQGNTTAYQIYTSEGDCLGVVGRIISCEKVAAANESRIEPARGNHSANWLHRALNKFRFRSRAYRD